jgi:hypothetical protein
MNLVNELQVSAENDDVLTVLRKTRRLASKLDRRDIMQWLQAEQGGFADRTPVPDYRRVNVGLSYNTNGYVPAGWGYMKNGVFDLPTGDLMGGVKVSIRDSIGVVLSWVEALDSGRHIYNPIEDRGLCRSLHEMYQFNPMVAGQITFLNRLYGPQIKAIPERIKDTVLDWACDLERAGVTGDGMSFSAEEKQIAHSVTFKIHNSTVEQLTSSGINEKRSQ